MPRAITAPLLALAAALLAAGCQRTTAPADNPPLAGATIEPGEPFAIASVEPFLAWGGNVRGNTFDQARFVAALGWQLSRASRVEVGYLQQLLQRGDGRTLERNHTLQLTFGSTAPLTTSGCRAVR